MNPKLINRSTLVLALAQAFACAAALAQSTEKTLPEVVVEAARPAAERAARVAVGGLSEQPLAELPMSVNVVGQALMQDLQIRSATEAVKLDASVSDSYNAVGYAEQFSIRGYKLGNARGYRKDGLAIPGDAPIPLENKERVEILKGLAGVQLGSTTPGGALNFVTKRPTAEPLRTATFGLSERGTRYGALDLGGMSEDKRFGYRINLAAEGLRSYVKGADGNRRFASAAFDWHVTPDLLLQADADYQYRAQLSQPGFQLFNGTDLPTGVDASMMLNKQPWSKPVTTRTANLGLRAEYRLAGDWRVVGQANKQRFLRDDFAAFPWGCSSGGFWPGYCANGEFDVYDYQSAGEKQDPLASQAFVAGSIRTGAVSHALTAGLSTYQRRDYAGDCVYGMVDCDGSVANGVSNIFHPQAVPPAPIVTGPVVLQRRDDERAAFVQDVIGVADGVKLHAGARHVRLTQDGYRQSSWLPNLALVWTVQPGLSLYGAWSSGLEAGGIAPLGTSNYRQQLAPSKSRQAEFGLKADLAADLFVTAALFQIEKPLAFAKLLKPTDALETFVRAGDAVHRGVEFAATGRVAPRLTLQASLTALDAKQKGTGFATLDGKRATDVPKLKATALLDYSLQSVPGLALNARWQYASNKAFDVENRTLVPAYHVFDLGARYATRLGRQALTLRLAVENVTDKFYWRDVTPALGGYLYPGAPRLVRASAQLDF